MTKLIALSVLSALAGLCVACGSDHPTSPSAPTATTTASSSTTPTPTPAPTKVAAKPALSVTAAVTISPEPLFLFRAKFTYTFTETGGVTGINVNFLNTSITQGGVTSPSKNYDPGAFIGIWGTNHIGAGRANAVTETFDYNGGLISRIVTHYTASVGDDYGNQFQSANDVSGSLSLVSTLAIPSLGGRDPSAYQLVP